MATWNIQYANDDRPTIQVFGDRDKAEATAKKRNKYNESYTITEAPKKDYELDKELAAIEAVKYGCSMRGMS
jgi:hypothetical protein